MKDVKKKVVIKVTDDGSLKKTKKQIDEVNKSTKRASKGSMEYNRNMKGLSKQSSNASKNFSKQSQGMQGVLVPAYAEIAARVFALTAAFNALSRAANYSLLIKGQAEYAKMTGKDMGNIAKQVQKASKYMLDFKEASTSVALATTAGLGTGQIVKMTKAAVDSSTALGRSMTDTMDRLTRGIVKAEPEILDEIGVIIRLDTVYKEYAESVSKSTTELTESEKLMARNTAIMGQLEDKFGGIADKLPPNYFQQLSSTVMDLINMMSSKLVDVVGPLLKFLSESKTLIVVLMAVIAKSLIGKIFPAFTSFGNKMAALPGKMSKNIAKIDKRMGKFRGAMSKAEVASTARGIIPESARGPAFGRDPMASGRATLQQARGSLKGGVVTFGGLKGTSEADLIKKEKLWKKLNGEVNRGKLGLHNYVGALNKTHRAFLTMKKSASVFLATQVQAWRTVGLAINKHGLFKGTIVSLKILKRQWREAGREKDKNLNKITKYERLVKKASLAVGVLSGALKFLSVAAGKLMSVFFGITMFFSIAKAIVSIWHDFDTPFARAAESSKTLNDELKKTLITLEERDEIINFEGRSESLQQTLKSAAFTANMADQIYQSTKTAFKKLGDDVKKMGFWDKVVDGFKSAIGKGLKDTMEAGMGNLLKNIAQLDPTFVQEFLTEAGVKDNILGVFLKEQADLEGMIDVFAKKYSRAPIGSPEWTEGQGIRSELLEWLKEFEEQSTHTTLALKDFGDTLTKYSKDLKGILESFVTKTPWYDMMKSQKNIVNQWTNRPDKMTDTGVLQLISKAGLFRSNYEDKNLNSAVKAFKDNENDANAAKLMKVLGPDAMKAFLMITGVDAVANNLAWAKSAEVVAGHQADLNRLKKLGNSTLEKQSQLQKLVLAEELKQKQELYNLNKKYGAFGPGGDLEGLEASALRDIQLTKDKITATEAIHVTQLKYRDSLTATTTAMWELEEATRADLEAEGLLAHQIDQKIWDERTTRINKYIVALDKTINRTIALANWTEDYNKGSDEQRDRMDAAQDLALQYSSFAGVTDPELRKELMGSSVAKGIGTGNYKQKRTGALFSQFPELRSMPGVVSLAFDVEKLRAENLSSEAYVIAERYLLETEYLKAQEDLRDAIWKERAATFGAAMNTVANSFGSAVSGAFNDIFMNKGFDMTKFRTTLAQGFASAGSKLIGDMTQKAVFGNKGLVAGMLRGMGMGDDWINTLFPKSELEMAQERTNYLRSLVKDGIKILGFSPYAQTVTGTGKTGLSYVDTNPPGVEGAMQTLDPRYLRRNTYGYDKQGGFIGEGFGGDDSIWRAFGFDQGSGTHRARGNLSGRNDVAEISEVAAAIESGILSAEAKSLMIIVAEAQLVEQKKTSEMLEMHLIGPAWPKRMTPGPGSMEETLRGEGRAELLFGNTWLGPASNEEIGKNVNTNLNSLLEGQKALERLTTGTSTSLIDIEHNTSENGTLGGFMDSLGTAAGEGAKKLFGVITGSSNGGFGSKSIFGKGPNNSFSSQSSFGSQILGAIIETFLPFGSGGIAPGGFRAFAKGGIANRPTLGLVGEGGMNEAVVPLPDGRAIPVKGAGTNNVTVNVSVDAQGQSSATESSGDGAKELGFMLSQAVQAELVEQQRPGGLLSSY